MALGPLGYWGVMSVGGILLQLIGFIYLLPEFKKLVKKLGEKVGDSDREVKATGNLVNFSGIYFVIAGTVLQLISTVMNAYMPNFLANSSWPF